MSDHYQTLGISRSATDDEIKKAYRKLAMKHHPDRGGNVAEFQLIEEAYRVLSNPDQRRQYDNAGVKINVNGREFTGGTHSFDFDTIFDMFGTRMGARQHQTQKNQRVTIWIPLADAVQGGKRLVSINSPGGTSTLELAIPIGVEDNENVRYPGLAPGNNDLIVNFRVHGHPNWQRNGQDLFTERGLDFWQLILGTEIQIQDLSNRTFNLTVPPRTRPGTMLRARGKGVSRNGHNSGDLFVKIQAVMPDRIPDEIVEILRKNSDQ